MFTYQWKKVGSDSLSDTASGENSANFTIILITPTDGGMYYCIVMNQWGKRVQSDNATVNVLCELMCTVSIYNSVSLAMWQLIFDGLNFYGKISWYQMFCPTVSNWSNVSVNVFSSYS